MLEVGIKAPEFALLNQDGKKVSLSDFKEKKVVRRKFFQNFFSK